MVINNAKIIEVNPPVKTAADNFWVKYSYTLQNTTYRSTAQISGIFFRDFKREFIHKSFPVIYLPSHPQKSEVLITPDRFERFGINFPDTLKWVRQYWTKDYKTFD
jgi:hypothetical protein